MPGGLIGRWWSSRWLQLLWDYDCWDVTRGEGGGGGMEAGGSAGVEEI